MVKTKKRKAFIREKTGSATMINLDGKSKPDFDGDYSDDQLADVKKNKKNKTTKSNK